MYHDVVNAGELRRRGAHWFAVTAARFGRQLDLVREMGYQGCSIGECLTGSGRSVALSFDDGLRSHYDVVFPALANRGMTATFFVVTDWVGKPGYATWAQLREMRNSGMAIQSHSRTHRFLSELDATAVADELAQSKAVLDERLEQHTDQLALPGGDPPRARLWGLFAEAGYRVVATSRWGVNRSDLGDSVFLLRRCTVAGDFSDDYFARVVAGDRMIVIRRRAREVVLNRVRAFLGASRYAAWRRRVVGDTPLS